MGGGQGSCLSGRFTCPEKSEVTENTWRVHRGTADSFGRCSSQQGCLFRSSTPFHSSEPLSPRPGRSLEESGMGWGGCLGRVGKELKGRPQRPD